MSREMVFKFTDLLIVPSQVLPDFSITFYHQRFGFAAVFRVVYSSGPYITLLVDVFAHKRHSVSECSFPSWLVSCHSLESTAGYTVCIFVLMGWFYTL